MAASDGQSPNDLFSSTERSNAMSEQIVNRPTWSKKARGGLSIAVWSHSDPEGCGTLFSVTHKKRYKDKQGQWQDSNSLFPEDLPKLIQLFEQAFDSVTLYEDDKKDEQE
jgi:hypothetical protein